MANETLAGTLASGGEAAAHAAFALSDLVVLQPAAEAAGAATLGGAALQWSAASRANCFGRTPAVLPLERGECTGAQLVAHLEGRGVDADEDAEPAVGGVLSGSGALRRMLPNVHRLAAARLPCVLHVAAARLNAAATGLEADLSDVAALRESGVAILAASSVQEVHDLGVIAQIAAIKASAPIVNVFDGTRLASELSRVNLLPFDTIHALLSAARSFSSLGDTITSTMETCATALGKRYSPFEYEGPQDADLVIVAMGMPARAVLEAVRSEVAKAAPGAAVRVGVLRVLMLRPWSNQAFLAALPGSTQRVCVIDQNKSGDNDNPLFKDVAAAFHSDAQWATPTLISANLVVSSKVGLTPPRTRAILNNLAAEKPRLRVTLADLDVPNPFDAAERFTSGLVRQAVSWTMGDRAIEARHALSVVLGPFLGVNVQQNDQTSKATSVSRSDIRFAPFELTSTYPVIAADVIACDDVGVLLLPHVDVLAQARPKARLLVNAAWTNASQADIELDAATKARIAELELELFAVDATGLARAESNWVTQTALAKLCEAPFFDYRQVYTHMSKLIRSNVAGGDAIADKLAHTEVDSLLHKIEYDAAVWAAASTANRTEADFTAPDAIVPADMLPVGLLATASSGEAASTSADDSSSASSVPAYHNLLTQLFGGRLVVADTTGGPVPTELEDGDNVKASLEMCFGSYLVKAQARKRLVNFVQRTISGPASSSHCSKELLAALGMWHGIHDNAMRCAKVVPHLIELLAEEKHKSTALEYIYDNRGLLHKSSKWIIGGNNWAYDLSNSGIRHIIASGEDINVLIFDTDLYDDAAAAAAAKASSTREVDLNSSAMSVLSSSSRGATSPADAQAAAGKVRRKKDIGLYAMNYGTAYVASVSILASQSQAMRAVAEADAFKGPSIILAHAPRVTAALAELGVRVAHSAAGGAPNDATDQTRMATKAVDEGKWPLYRWNPSLEDNEFTLDSAKLKAEIQEFLKREQNLSLLANATPKMPEPLNESLEAARSQQHEELQRRATQRRMNEQLDQLIDGIGGAGGNKDLGLLVLYGSDGGNGSGVAEKLAKKAEVSGCGEVRCMEANDFSVDNLGEEKHVILVLATAGQGEACANAKSFSETLLEYPNKLPGVKYAVFGLGDSHYWGEGSADSARYFCLNAREVDEKLHSLGAERIVPVGLGDDQDDDGYEGALGPWEEALWETLDVKIKGGAIGGPPPIVDDDIKIKSNFLRGMIDEGLNDHTTGKLLPEDTKLTKFHGIYQQDLRSVREELDAKGLERAYSFMIRIGVPGGVATSEQYIAMDDLCTKYANGALKLTTRQAYQFHGVLKRNLKTTMKGINRAAMDTLAACGDVNRNIIANPHHRQSGVHKQVHELAVKLQAYLRPKTSAYAEIWLDKKPVAGSVDHEPIYGATYLPRKFKIAIAVPPLNDVDVFAHCLGFIAIQKNGKLLGFNITVGGGMGTTHGNKATYPRLSDVLGFCTLEQAVKVAESVVIVQRDNGDRDNRKHARLKYTVEDMGLDVFRGEVEKLCGFKLGKAHPFKFDTNADPYGWHQAPDGTWQYVLFVENGYIKDRADYKIKTALREIAEAHVGGEISLTATQNIIIGAITPERKPVIEELMRKYNIDNTRYSAMRLHSMACVALPTCALAMAESQTYLPSLIDKIEVLLDESGLRHDAITIRMTGCPNGCGRPTLAEIGFIGKAPGQYNMYLGAGFAGNRISKMYKEGVDEEEILAILGPMLKAYATTRQDGEHFGDFCVRTGIIEPTLQGRCFWSTGKENLLETPSGTTQIYW